MKPLLLVLGALDLAVERITSIPAVARTRDLSVLDAARRVERLVLRIRPALEARTVS